MKNFFKNHYLLYIIIYIIIILFMLFSFSGCFTNSNTTDKIIEKADNVKIIVISPIPGEKVYKKLKVKFVVRNLAKTIVETRLYIDNDIVSIKKEGEFSFLVDIDFLKDKKEYNIFVGVIDNTGTEYKSEPVKVIVDSDVPQIILLTDIDEKTISKIQILNKEIIAKNDFDKLEVYIDGKLYKTITDINSDIVIDPEKIGDGEHKVYFKIYDKNNNFKKTQSSKFIVKSAQNTKSDKTTETKNESSNIENANNETKQNQAQVKKDVNSAIIVSPENHSGVLADYLKVTVKNASGLYFEVSNDPDFKKILVKTKIEQDQILELKDVNKTGVYFLRFSNGKDFSSPYIIGFIKDNLVKIDSTEFIMGDDKGKFDSEKPSHKVKLDTFYISSYEITKEEFEVFLNVTGYKTTFRFKKISEKEYKEPITNVTWYDAKSFCSWLGVRLPYEAEWEYVAKTQNNYKYSWGNEGIGGNMKGVQDGYSSLAPVDAFKPNQFGIYNLSGNVWEWCEDWYNPNYYSSSPIYEPKGPSYGTSKVIRGGSYKDDLIYLRTTTRGAINPYSTLDNVGFRIARSGNE